VPCVSGRCRRRWVSVRALRYYEEQGLVIADRTPSGHRQYPESAVERVRFIQLLYAAGLSSKTILQVLPFLDTLVATPRMTQRSRTNATASGPRSTT